MLSLEQEGKLAAINKINQAARYKNLGKQEKESMFQELVKYFGGSTAKAKRAQSLYETGEVTSPKEAEQVLRKEELKDHAWGG